MNKVILVGRLTADPEVNYTTGENASANARFSVAVNRPFKNSDGVYDADFIRCVAWRNNAEFIQKYFHKGSMIGLDGYIRTGSYTNKDGQKVYTTEVWVDRVEFVGGKNDNAQSASTPVPQKSATPPDNSWMNAPAGEEEELPF